MWKFTSRALAIMKRDQLEHVTGQAFVVVEDGGMFCVYGEA